MGLERIHWTTPEKFLRTWVNHLHRADPADRMAVQRKREYLKVREAFVVAMILEGVGALTDTRWVFEMPEDDPPDAVAVRSMCHGQYTGERLRVPIEVVSVPALAVQQHWSAGASLEENLYRFLCAKKLDRKKYQPGTDLYIHMGVPHTRFACAELAALVAQHDHEFGDIWLLANNEGADPTYLVRQLYPFERETTIDTMRYLQLQSA